MEILFILFRAVQTPSQHKHAGPVWVVGGQHGLPRDGLRPGLTLGSARVPRRLPVDSLCHESRLMTSTNTDRVGLAHVRYQFANYVAAVDCDIM